MTQAIINQREDVTTLPSMVADSCVHSKSHQASCTACIDACPDRAWLLDDDGLKLHAAACDGCGLCVPACPQDAIQIELEPANRQLAGQAVAFFACDRVPDAGGEGKIACLHALGALALARLHRQGTLHLVIARGDCKTCPRGEADSLEQTLQFVNLYLIDRGLAPIELSELEAASWMRARANSGKAGVNGVSRRRLFRRAADTVANAGEEMTDAPAPPTLGCLIAESERPDAIMPCSPVIAPERCEGCDACLRLCPHGVFAFGESAEDGGSGYEIDSARCTGCGLCADVCEVDAVTLERWSRSQQRRLPLDHTRCRACGVHFHMPKGRLPADGLCRICSRTGFHKNLYQVLD